MPLVRYLTTRSGPAHCSGYPAPCRAPLPSLTAPLLGQGRRRGAAASPAEGDADLQMALAVSASLRDEQERTRRLAESQLLELGLGDEVEAARDSGAAVPPEPTAPAPVLLQATGQTTGQDRATGSLTVCH